MVSSELKEGGLYWAHHTSGRIKVKLVSITTHAGNPLIRTRARTFYYCVNLRTGREVVFHSAMKFKSEASQDAKVSPILDSFPKLPNERPTEKTEPKPQAYRGSYIDLAHEIMNPSNPMTLERIERRVSSCNTGVVGNYVSKDDLRAAYALIAKLQASCNCGSQGASEGHGLDCVIFSSGLPEKTNRCAGHNINGQCSNMTHPMYSARIGGQFYCIHCAVIEANRQVNEWAEKLGHKQQ